jgi:hypothetical protein
MEEIKMMKNAEGKKMISGMVANVLEDITDVFLTGSACKTRWGEVALPDNLRKYYEEKEEEHKDR